jgi:hypothetical protein
MKAERDFENYTYLHNDTFARVKDTVIQLFRRKAKEVHYSKRDDTICFTVYSANWNC